jgi:hypothetical protein
MRRILMRKPLLSLAAGLTFALVGTSARLYTPTHQLAWGQGLALRVGQVTAPAAAAA